MSSKESQVAPYGEPKKYDPTFNGPIKNRGCTDIICCILFIIFFAGMLAVGIFAFTRGDPIKLLYPTDSNGNICGYGDYESKPNLFFFDLLDCAKAGVAVAVTGCPTPQVCIESCPTKYWVYATQFAVEVAGGSSSGRSNMICTENVNPLTSSKSVQELITDDDCAAYYVESSAVVGRCVPAILSQVLESASEFLTSDNETVVDKFGNIVNGTALEEGSKYLAYFLNAKEYGMKIFQDVRASWWLILIFLGVAMVVSFIWILLLRCITCPLVWITIFLFAGVFGFGTYYCFDKYIQMKDNPENQVDGNLAFTTNLSYYTNLAVTWLILGIIAASFLGIILIVIIFLRTRIAIAIALIKESSRAIGSMMFTLIYPIVPFLMQIIVLGFWGISAVYLASMGQSSYGQANMNTTNVTVTDNSTGVEKVTYEIKQTVEQILDQIPCDVNANGTEGSVCTFLKYGGDEYTIYLQFFQLFMMFWTVNFVIALGQMTLAGAFASYYWAFDKPKDIPAFPLTGGLWRALRYHLGTLAFGSLLVAIIQIIRVFLEYVDSKLKGSENKVAKFFLQCLKCCFWCLEKFIRFINKNAYILTAVYGYNFCTAAKNAFMLIMRNIVRIAVVDKITDFVLFIGKLFVVGIICVIAFLFFSGDLAAYIPIQSISDFLKDYNPQLNYYLIPIIIIGFGSYVIAATFFSVYSMGVDTLFLCFLEDLERNDGSVEKPYYMSKELMGILGKKNKKPQQGGGESKKKGCCC